MRKALRAALVIASAFVLLSLCGCKIYEPVVKHGEFPFVLEYEKDGEHYLIEDTMTYTYDGHSLLFPSVIEWKYAVKNRTTDIYPVLEEFGEGTPSLFDEERCVVSAKVYADIHNARYYMGEPGYTNWKPRFVYTERFLPAQDESDSDNFYPSEHTYLNETELEELFGIKILRLEYGYRIDNEFIEIGEVF